MSDFYKAEGNDGMLVWLIIGSRIISFCYGLGGMTYASALAIGSRHAIVFLGRELCASHLRGISKSLIKQLCHGLSRHEWCEYVGVSDHVICNKTN